MKIQKLIIQAILIACFMCITNNSANATTISPTSQEWVSMTNMGTYMYQTPTEIAISNTPYKSYEVINFDLSSISNLVPTSFSTYLQWLNTSYNSQSSTLNLYYTMNSITNNFNLADLTSIGSININKSMQTSYVNWDLSNISWNSLLANDQTFSLVIENQTSGTTADFQTIYNDRGKPYLTLGANTSTPMPEPSSIYLAIIGIIAIFIIKFKKLTTFKL